MRPVPASRLCTVALVLAACGPEPSGGGPTPPDPAPATGDADAILARLAAEAPDLDPDWSGLDAWTDLQHSLVPRERELLAGWRSSPTAALAAELGEVYTLAEELGRAQAFLVLALAEDPDSPRAWNALARHRLLAARPDEAIVLARHSHALFPDQTEARLIEAQAFEAQGDGPGAVVAWEALLAIYPQSVEARLGLARANEDAGNLEEARRHLAAAARVAPDHTTLLHRQARVLRALGEDAEARRVEERHERLATLEDLQSHTRDATSLGRQFVLAEHFLRDGRVADAQLVFSGAWQRSTSPAENVRAATGLLRCARRSGDAEAVERWRQTLFGLDADHPALFEVEGQVEGDS